MAIWGRGAESFLHGVGDGEGDGDGSSCGCTLGGVTTLGTGAVTCCIVGGGFVDRLKIWARCMYALLMSLPYVRLGIVF